MKPRANELIAGFFVIIMFIVFIFFLSLASGRMGEWMNRRDVYMYTWFHNTGGLKPQTQVTFQGFKIGDVQSIDFDQKMKLIRVKMKVNADFTDVNLPEEAVAMITTASLLGDPYIELTSDFRTVDLDMLVRGERRIKKQKDDEGTDAIIVDSIDPAGWGTIQVQASNLLRDIQEQFGTVSDTISHILSSADALISDTKMREDILVMINRARIASEQFPATMYEARSMLASAGSAASRIDNLIGASQDTVASILTNANSAVEGVDRIVANSEDTIASIMGNVDEVTFNARALTFALSEKPSRLVWDDKERQGRLAAGDTSVIFASWRTPVVGGSGSYTAPAASSTRSGSSYGARSGGSSFGAAQAATAASSAGSGTASSAAAKPGASSSAIINRSGNWGNPSANRN